MLAVGCLLSAACWGMAHARARHTQVEETTFDPATCVIRVRGRNVEENKFVKVGCVVVSCVSTLGSVGMSCPVLSWSLVWHWSRLSSRGHVLGKREQMGAYHTIDLELSRNFTIKKHAWDAMFLERLKLATDVTKSADVAAVVMQLGLAHVILISGEMTLVRAKIEHSVPKKRIGSSGHRKGVERFFQLVMQVRARTSGGGAGLCQWLAVLVWSWCMCVTCTASGSALRPIHTGLLAGCASACRLQHRQSSGHCQSWVGVRKL